MDTSFETTINESRKALPKPLWRGSCLQYLEKVKEDPSIAQLAPGRIYSMVMTKGTEPAGDMVKLPD